MLNDTKNHIINGINIELPKVNSIKPIQINFDVDKSRCYFGTIYHMLSIVVEIQEAYKSNPNLEYFAQYDKIRKKVLPDYDFSFLNLFKENMSIEKSGSSMTNSTNIFNTSNIKLDILSPLFNKLNDSLSIRFPCVVSTSTIHMIYILGFIYDKVTLEKTDLWLNDSFVVRCNLLRKDNYNYIKKQLKNIAFTEKSRQNQINGLFKNFQIEDSFKYKFSRFMNEVGSVLCDIWLTIINNVNKSESDRKKNIWEEYDNLLLTRT